MAPHQRRYHRQAKRTRKPAGKMLASFLWAALPDIAENHYNGLGMTDRVKEQADIAKLVYSSIFRMVDCVLIQ